MDTTIDGSHMDNPGQEPTEASNNTEDKTVKRDAIAGLDVVETRELPREKKSLSAPKWLDAAKARLLAHKPMLGGLCALLAVVATVVVAESIYASNVPSNDLVAVDARTRVSEPDYDVGNYGDKTSLRVSSVDVRSVRTANDGELATLQPGASGYAKATVAVTFENDSVKAVETAELGFAKVAGVWTAVGGASDQRTTFEAKQGIDEQELIKNVSAALDTAEALQGGGSHAAATSPSLAAIYSKGSFDITENNFDGEAQTDDVTLHCEKRGAWGYYEAQITLHFEFRSVTGRWEMTSSGIPTTAGTRNYTPVLGTYQGTFQTQATDGKKCLAASASPLELKIDSCDGDQISGTVSLMAHLHANPQEDADGCDGDKELQEVQFKAKLEDGSERSLPRFKATLPDQMGGTVELELLFGSEDDPAAVKAIVTTKYSRTTSLLFIPYEQTATYEDTYTLQ